MTAKLTNPPARPTALHFQNLLISCGEPYGGGEELRNNNKSKAAYGPVF